MSERPTPAMLLQQGLFHHRQGQFALAMERYTEALRDDPENAEALYYVAVVACQQGDLATGVDLVRRSLTFDLRQPRAHNLLGQALQRQKQFDEALACYDKALEYDANLVDALANRANLLGEIGRHAEAIAAYDKVMALRPGLPQDWCNRGQSQHALGQFAEAIASYDRALALDPKFALAHNNRADALKDAGRTDDALAGYARATQLQPEVADFHRNHALALRDAGQAEAALAAVDRALARRADFAEAHAARGSILAGMGRHDQALDSLAHALALQPNMVAALLNRSVINMEHGHIAETRADFERAAACAPHDDEIAFSLAEIQLLMGDWDRGFVNFERRSNPRRPAYMSLPLPRWNGEPPGDYRLLLITEQDHRDVIQFSRFATLLASRGYPVALLVREEMAVLLRQLDGVEVLTAPGQLARNPQPVRWLPLMSVIQILHLTPDTIPAQAPYLAADAARAAAWAQRLGSAALKIGIAWQGGTEGKRAAHAAALAAFAPLAEIPGVRLISLQKAPGSLQIAGVAFSDRVEQPISDTDFGPDALPDIAALMAGLDLVVSIDTVSAHLAGALGRPVFVALRRVADWRWLLDRDDSPWYPSMRLFRQSREGEWNDVFARIAAAVREMFNRKSADANQERTPRI